MAIQLDFSSSAVGANIFEDNRELIDIPLYFRGIGYRCTCVAGEEIYCVMPFRLVTPKLAIEMGKKIEQADFFSKPVNTIIAQIVDRHSIIIEFYKNKNLSWQYDPIKEDLAYIAVKALNRMRYVSTDVVVENRGALVRVILD